jgi:hypothetical protein
VRDFASCDLSEDAANFFAHLFGDCERILILVVPDGFLQDRRVNVNVNRRSFRIIWYPHGDVPGVAEVLLMSELIPRDIDNNLSFETLI